MIYKMRPTSLLFILACIWMSVMFFSCGSSKETTSRNAHSQKTVKPKLTSKKDIQRKYAAMMDVNPKSIKNIRLYAFVENWYGVPYKYGGSGQSGVDCSGLVQQLYRNVYGKHIPRSSLEQYNESKSFRRVKKLREGDLVFFKTSGKKISHVGVYLQNGYFVHASDQGVRLNHIKESYWKQCYKAGGRIY